MSKNSCSPSHYEGVGLRETFKNDEEDVLPMSSDLEEEKRKGEKAWN